MNLILLEPDDISEGRAVLRGRRAGHITGVLGCRAGDSLRVGVVRGPRGSARVERVGGDEVCLSLSLSTAAEESPPIDMVLAVPRPKVVSRALQIAASFGVRRIDLVNAWRVDKSYFGSPRLAPSALGEDLILGCEQGGITWVPEVAVHRRLMPYLSSAEALWREGSARLIAHPRAEQRLEEAVPPGTSAPFVVAVGPEGGWIDRELGSFAELGFAQITLGPWTLRTEAAIAALMAQLSLVRRLQAPQTRPS